jgi:ParB family transcriptional regulator, chromosome partitioning protein
MMITLKGLQDIRFLNEIEEGVESATIHDVDVNNIVPGRYQPRDYFNQTALEELAKSIKKQGIIQPLILRKVDGCYEIIAGERRWRAAKLINLVTVPAIIRDIDDITTLAFSIIENLQREDLNAIEEATSFERLRTEFGLTHEQIALHVGKSRAAISNYLRLLKLPDELKCYLKDKSFEFGHARALLGLPFDKQKSLAQTIIKDKLTVRQTEEKVKLFKGQDKVSALHLKQNEVSSFVEQFNIAPCYQLKVKNTKKGMTEIRFVVDTKQDFIDFLTGLSDKIDTLT